MELNDILSEKKIVIHNLSNIKIKNDYILNTINNDKIQIHGLSKLFNLLNVKDTHETVGPINNFVPVKPFLKWVGGKTQIINDIISKIPKNIQNYHEPFIGGGSVLLSILSLNQNKIININGTINAYDINASLINLYKRIQNNKDELYDLIQIYISCPDEGDNKSPTNINEALGNKESYYYWLRLLYNKEPKTTVNNAALFIVINKLCFRGMYRESKNGFNVPFGNYKKLTNIITKDELYKISNLIQNVNFICQDFEKCFTSLKCNDFIYLDPPYMSKNNKGFVNYNVDGFDENKHNTLFNLIKASARIGVNFILSNAKVKYIENIFKEFNINEIICKRSINSKKPGSTAMELLIYN